MTLGDLIDQIRTSGDDTCIFAKRPWTAESQAMVSVLGSDLGTPVEATRLGLDYFLEVDVALEVLGGFEAAALSRDEKQRLLSFYAENDALPAWVFDRD